jgi:hypothetical protein
MLMYYDRRRYRCGTGFNKWSEEIVNTTATHHDLTDPGVFFESVLHRCLLVTEIVDIQPGANLLNENKHYQDGTKPLSDETSFHCFAKKKKKMQQRFIFLQSRQSFPQEWI